jgi:hypothetical protein
MVNSVLAVDGTNEDVGPDERTCAVDMVGRKSRRRDAAHLK